jgi:hypothetical protein
MDKLNTYRASTLLANFQISKYKNIFFYIISTLVVLPLWIVEYPPMIDLPQHVAMMNDYAKMLSGNEVHAQFIEPQFFTPYFAAYFVSLFLALFFPMLIAVKIMLSMAIFLFLYSIKKIIRFIDGDEYWSYLGMTVAISSAYYWGFITFIVALPIGLLYFIYGVNYAGNPTRKKAILLAVFGVGLFFCHMLVSVYFTAALFLYVILQNKNVKKNVVIALPILSFLPIFLAYIIIKVFGESSGDLSTISWQHTPGRYKVILASQLGYTSYLNNLLGILVLVTPFLLGGRFSRKISRLAPFILVLAIVLLAPNYMLGVALLWSRYTILLLPMLLFALDFEIKNRHSQLRQFIPIILATASIYISCTASLDFSKKQQPLINLFEKMEPNLKVQTMIYYPYNSALGLPTYEHIGLWYQYEKGGFVAPNFARFFNLPRIYKDNDFTKEINAIPGARNFSWLRSKAGCFDYFLARNNRDEFLFGLKKDAPKVKLIATEDVWWLYRNIARETCAWDTNKLKTEIGN